MRTAFIVFETPAFQNNARFAQIASTGTYHGWKRKFGGMEVSEAKRLRALEEENSRLKRLVADQAVQMLCAAQTVLIGLPASASRNISI